MRATADERYEALYLTDPTNPGFMSASAVAERLGLPERNVQRWANKAYGRIPTRRELKRRNPEREAQVRQAEADGLDRRYCLLGHSSYHPTLLRRLPDGSVAFVCRKHARRGDF